MNPAQTRQEILHLLSVHRMRHREFTIIETVKMLSLRCPTDSDDELLHELRRVVQ